MSKKPMLFLIFFSGIAMTWSFLLYNSSFYAYEKYAQTDAPDSGYCYECHPAFDGKGDLHSLHVGTNAFTNECFLCHIQKGDVPYLYKSGDPGDGPQKGCTGCHGKDYGEISEGGSGPAKDSGYGLRKQHLLKGVTCEDSCHFHNDQLEPYPEDTRPDYYGRPDVNLTDPCDSSDEDGSPEPNGEDSVGLDNDGDGTIDASDRDCQWTGPSRIVNFRFHQNKQDFDWSVSPDADSYDILRGYINDLRSSSGSFINAICWKNDNPSNSGNDPDDPPMGDGFYYLVRGQVTGAAGTYNSDGIHQQGDRDATALDCAP